MNHISPLADLIREQESDALDDGLAYEHMGGLPDIIGHGDMQWVTPTAFMVVSMKELLSALVRIHGWNGHWLLREIGRNNLQNPSFVSELGLTMFLRLYDAALMALPADERGAFQ